MPMKKKKRKKPKSVPPQGKKKKQRFIQPIKKGMELFRSHFGNGQKQIMHVGKSKIDEFGRPHYLGHDKSIVSKELHARARVQRKAAESNVVKQTTDKTEGRD
ncbi:hypothetical protein LCGC14_3112970 [marine sediment metagenome]|uniref:Uncharacterized protein n=1 Tax=marine sediment metagenome TaxID=412755 RepID=A0A0F8WTJ0_9ZZZZ